MSLQRIFESAKRLGLPLIVTDTEGRDPMVILPLGEFEVLSRAQKSPIFSQKPVESAPEGIHEDIVADISEEIPVEERFYLEPLDERA